MGFEPIQPMATVLQTAPALQLRRAPRNADSTECVNFETIVQKEKCS